MQCHGLDDRGVYPIASAGHGDLAQLIDVAREVITTC
jgi:hypothetical protein